MPDAPINGYFHETVIRQSIIRIGFKTIPKKFFENGAYYFFFFFIKAATTTFPTQTGVETENIYFTDLMSEKTDFEHLSIQICVVLINVVI